MIKNKKSIIIGITTTTLVALILIGLTYAYYRTKIYGNTQSESISVASKNLELTYIDGSEDISLDNLEPSNTVYTKEFSVKNTGNEKINNYGVYLEDVINTLERYEDLQITLTCKSVNSETLEESGTCDGYSGHFPNQDDLLVINDIDLGLIHQYKLEMIYKNVENIDQTVDMNKNIIGTIQIYAEEDIVNLKVTNEEYLLKKVYNENIELGDKVNYISNVSDYTGNWKLLGIEDGQLLLISDSVGTLQLVGTEGFTNGVQELNNMCTKFGEGIGAEKARSVTADDINQVTGFNPEKVKVIGQRYGLGTDAEYGNHVTFKIVNNNIEFTGSNGFYSDGSTVEVKRFRKFDGTELVSDDENDYYEITNNYYDYVVINTGQDIANENKSIALGLTVKQNAMVSLDFVGEYWLATEAVLGKVWTASWGIMSVSTPWGSLHTSTIRRNSLYSSNPKKEPGDYTNHVRAVVYLDKNAKLEWDSTNEYWNIVV